MTSALAGARCGAPRPTDCEGIFASPSQTRRRRGNLSVCLSRTVLPALDAAAARLEFQQDGRAALPSQHRGRCVRTGRQPALIDRPRRRESGSAGCHRTGAGALDRRPVEPSAAGCSLGAEPGGDIFTSGISISDGSISRRRPSSFAGCSSRIRRRVCG